MYFALLARNAWQHHLGGCMGNAWKSREFNAFPEMYFAFLTKLTEMLKKLKFVKTRRKKIMSYIQCTHPQKPCTPHYNTCIAHILLKKILQSSKNLEIVFLTVRNALNIFKICGECMLFSLEVHALLMHSPWRHISTANQRRVFPLASPKY